MQIDPATLSSTDLYRLMISVVVPRPIAWVSSRSRDGTLNAAPFSYFQAVSSKPPVVMIAVGKRSGGVLKDTRRNIEETGEFVVNVVSESSAARMVQTSADYDAAVSEFGEVGLGAAASERVAPPRIEECAVSMECRLDRILEVGGSSIVLGEVVLFHVAERVLAGDGATVDPARLRPLGRLGGAGYAPLREVVEIPRGEPIRSAGRLLGAEDAELVALWRELRDRSVAMARTLKPEHLGRTLGNGGETLGRLFRHLAGCTTWVRLLLAGREEQDEIKEWDPSWTPQRLAGELEEDREAFSEAIAAHLPAERDKLRRMIRHEAWHQGQVAAAVRDAFEPGELWKA
ncbi:MAG: flavin reductase [Planctomycetota bacterium]